MPAGKTKKFASEIDAKLYKEFAAAAKRTDNHNGMCWSRRWLTICTMWFRPNI